jgi:hypothetical protein
MPLEKSEGDFARMGWHDATVLALAIDYDVVELSDGLVHRGPTRPRGHVLERLAGTNGKH